MTVTKRVSRAGFHHWCPLQEQGTSEQRKEKGGNEKRSYRSRERKDDDRERHSTLDAKHVRAGDASPPFMDSAEEHDWDSGQGEWLLKVDKCVVRLVATCLSGGISWPLEVCFSIAACVVLVVLGSAPARGAMGPP